MRVGDSPDTIEAAYTLHGAIPAGAWHLVGDGIITGTGVTNISVSFEVRVRPQAAMMPSIKARVRLSPGTG